MHYFCPKCGNKVPEDHQFCSKCGTKVPKGNGGRDEEQEKPKKNLLVILSLIFVILIAVSLIAGLFFGKLVSEKEDPVIAQQFETAEEEQAEESAIETDENIDEEVEKDSEEDQDVEDAGEEEDEEEDQENNILSKPAQVFGDGTYSSIVYLKDGDLHFYKAGYPYSYPLNLNAKASVKDIAEGNENGIAMIRTANTIQITDDETKLFYLEYKYMGKPISASTNFSLYMKDVSHETLMNGNVAEKGTLLKENVSDFTISPDGTKVLYLYTDKYSKLSCVGMLNLNSDLDKDFLVATDTYSYYVNDDFTSITYSVKDADKGTSIDYRKALDTKTKAVVIGDTDEINVYMSEDQKTHRVYTLTPSYFDRVLIYEHNGSIVFRDDSLGFNIYTTQQNSVVYEHNEGENKDLYLYSFGAPSATVLAKGIDKIWAVDDACSVIFYTKTNDEGKSFLYCMYTTSGMEKEIMEVFTISDIKWHEYDNALYILDAFALSRFQPEWDKQAERFTYVSSEVSSFSFMKNLPGLHLSIRNDGSYYYDGENLTPGNGSYDHPTQNNCVYYVQLISGNFGRNSGDLIQFDINHMQRRFLDSEVLHPEGMKVFRDIYYKNNSHITEYSMDDKNFFYLKDYIFESSVMRGNLYHQNQAGEITLIDEDVSFKLFPQRSKEKDSGQFVSAQANYKYY